jgi:hypothetical protein
MDKLITEQQVAALLLVTPDTLERWRREGRGPVYVKMGHLVRYRLEDVENFVEACSVDPQQEKNNNAIETKRKRRPPLSLEVPRRWPAVHRKHRFGAHQTQSSRRAAARSGNQAPELKQGTTEPKLLK